MKIFIGLLNLLSRLPLGVLYVFSDICSFMLHRVVRYRRDVVRMNIDNSFPELDVRERWRIERRFYDFFCDYVVETLKLFTMSADEMKRRMVMEGVDDMERTLKRHPFVFVYLGHYCNWEWISSLPLWINDRTVGAAQLYRPLNDKRMDKLFLDVRSRFGAENVSKYDAYRHIIHLKKEGRRTIIGFIADQSPGTNSIHDWVDFLHQDTPVFTGTERIAKKVDAAIYFADVRRERRGHYRLRFRLLTDDVTSFENWRVTELYMRQLEEMIRRQPHLWLWSHKRWKYAHLHHTQQ